jgi:excinuclease UvrABC nuclease subunit
MRKRIIHLEGDLKKLVASPRLKLNKNYLSEVPEAWGLYRIFLPRSDGTLYIGKSKNIKRRLRSDLLTLTGRHTLKNKLKYGWKFKGKEIISYLNQCRVQLIIGKERHITQLEHFAIAVLEPKLND